jgi:hypothetical protein
MLYNLSMELLLLDLPEAQTADTIDLVQIATYRQHDVAIDATNIEDDLAQLAKSKPHGLVVSYTATNRIIPNNSGLRLHDSEGIVVPVDAPGLRALVMGLTWEEVEPATPPAAYSVQDLVQEHHGLLRPELWGSSQPMGLLVIRNTVELDGAPPSLSFYHESDLTADTALCLIKSHVQFDPAYL